MKRPVDSDSPPTTDKAKKAKKAKREAVTDTATPSSSTTTSTSESLAVTSDAARKEAKKAKKQRKEKAKKEDEAAPPIAKEDVQVKNDTKVKEKEKKTKRKKKSKRETSGPLPTPGEGARAAPGPAAAATAVFFEDAVQAIIARVAQDGSPTLSDLLNPDHGAFDAELKAQWKSLPKKGRAAIVAADQGRIADLRRAGEEALSRLPYTTEPDDHCESPPEAYADVAPFLDLVAATLGKTRATLEIYDPYFCAGAMKKHLAALGFARVRNECVDFYEVIRTNMVPEHDVLVTNPPYSADHVARLLRFCGASGSKPYCLLMPSYVATKPYFLAALMGPTTLGLASREPPVLVCPRKRYNYWTPKGLRAAGKVQGHVSSLGHRTSPFVSYWFVDLGPAVPKHDLLRQRAALAGGTLLLCETLAEFPSALRP